MNSDQIILIKGGCIVNHDETFIADILIENGLIKQINKDILVSNGTKVINAQGKLVIPGGIDSHTHLDLYFNGYKTVDDFYTGTRAAIAGGTTTIMNYIFFENRNLSLLKAYDRNMDLASRKSCCDFAFHMCVYNYNDRVGKEMEILSKEKGINSFKAIMAYKDSFMINGPNLIEFFKKCKELGSLAMVHAINSDLKFKIDTDEALATQRAISLGTTINCPIFIVHVMSKQSARLIQEARQQGSIVFGEPIAADLATENTHFFNQCWRHAVNNIRSPLLKTEPYTSSYLMDFLADSDLVVAGSDHCVFNTIKIQNTPGKIEVIPNGVNGIEDRMSIIWDRGVHTGKLTPNKFVAVTSTNAAKIFNIYPRKGRIAVGSDADIVIWNPNASRTISSATHHQVSEFNVFEGITCYGIPECVISNGKCVLENGKLNVTKGIGRFIQTPCFSDLIYSKKAI